MADSKGRPVDIADPSRFTPKSRAKFKSILTAGEDTWIDVEDLSSGGDPRDQSLRFPRSLDPTILSKPPLSIRRLRPVRLIALIGCASMIAGGIIMLWGNDGERPGVGNETGEASLLSRLSAPVAGDPRPASSPAPRLVVTAAPGALQLDKGSTLGLGVYGAADGAQLVIGGYTAGSVFSVGQSIGENAWRFPASQIENATLIPPRGFAGIMDVAMTLMLANGDIADRRTVRLEWLLSRQIDPGEISALLARGNALMATGDLSAARLVYQRAAEAGNARAAFALAETYDPIVLKTLEQSLPPNVATAHAWYRKAKDLGSREALDRLERLEQRSE
jgi:hypothetical protein